LTLRFGACPFSALFLPFPRSFPRPFAGRPTLEQWQALIGHLLSLHEQAGLSLVAIDPLASFLPYGSENHASTMLAALLPLQRLTSAGLSVLLLHHPRKKYGLDGLSARGSGALTGHADIQMELHWYEEASSPCRRRRLLAWSRHDETPRHRIIELSADGTKYNFVADGADDADQGIREALWEVLEQTMTKLTRKEVLLHWPEDEKPPSPTALWGLLGRAVERGELKCDGSGTRNDPFPANYT
jgi:calcineurin-like phosphoesterase family protein